MATHISIAKASFGASLLRPDVSKVSRDDLPVFHDAFEAMLVHCSSRNIETCKQWLLKNVVVSSVRTAALGKYLLAVSRHLAGEDAQTTLLRRQRLHILYLVNDLLHHGKYHTPEVVLRGTLTQSLQPFLADLFYHASSDAKVRVSRRLADLVDLWKQEEYFGHEIIAQLENSSTGAAQATGPTVEPTPKSDGQVKELPYLLPPTHGDPSLPYYDLPAGNLMRHIVPNSSHPMRPDEIRALQLSSGPADKGLVTALKDFLRDVDGRENSLSTLDGAGHSPEVDELGQIFYHGEGGDLVGDTYYGWSLAFCEKTKKRGLRGSTESSRRSRSRSIHLSRSISSRKRKRRNDSSRGRSRSSGSYSRSSSRLRPEARERHVSRSRSRPRSRSRSYSPQYSPKLEQRPRIEPSKNDISTTIPPVFHPLAPQRPFAPPAAVSMPFPPLPFAPTGMPVPPRPPQWLGPWPPPPPLPSGNPSHANMPYPPPPRPPNPPYPPRGWPKYPNSGQNNQYYPGRQ